MKISLNQCGKNYHRSWLFQGVSLEIDIQGIGGSPLRLAILGPNGAGKSTFTLMLVGQVDPTEGQIDWVDVAGKAIKQSHWHQWYSLASPGMELPEEFTLSEWFDFHQQTKGFQAGITLSTLIDLCGFQKNTATKSLLTFSSGMKQRVKLCAALLGEQPLVILDEPLTNLDKAGYEVYQHLLANYLGSRGLIIASNREDEWQNHCTHRYTVGDPLIKAI
jgi:ABC-type multidrug transport system ATPase subunit